MPQEWKDADAFKQLCILRALRPDRCKLAAAEFVSRTMGQQFLSSPVASVQSSVESSCVAAPLFFVLTPGSDPVRDVQACAQSQGRALDNGGLSVVSLGHGREPLAEAELDRKLCQGGWVVLQNVHLVPRWLAKLSNRLEVLPRTTHPEGRLFLTAEPPRNPHHTLIPASLLQRCIKVRKR